ncbi:F510_1955 family glycosylhydrolase [Arthrobacter sp. ISL-30]|uniref:F510_1955 family glycosylhydrolase n=1 Tax=Arthrobacter sp. ISL-30 TaxID=2819109 RepID=UPI001BEA9FBC|nr:exo-alpha-sialidase [Arthrobacter sp. ISL-30]MBT2515481.1 exo-alpha-sialidase [Arthrobacter sp. ISL-30]
MSLPPTRRLLAAATAAAALVLSIPACTTAPAPDSAPTTGNSNTLPSAHVHGLSVNTETDQVLLATHEGLFDVTRKPAVKIGPTNDLMGFTPAKEQGVFYASGHPGKDSSLPEPMGLIKTSDGGKTWEQLSRQGESDFHALTTTRSGIVAFDGVLRTSADGRTWKTATVDFTPAVLAGNPLSDTVLATTRGGVQRSTDGGITWALQSAAPVIQFAAFANEVEAVGVEPDGAIQYSADGGVTWAARGQLEGQVMAIAATSGSEGKPWIWAATSEGLLVSTDGGTTFRPSDAV